MYSCTVLEILLAGPLKYHNVEDLYRFGAVLSWGPMKTLQLLVGWCLRCGIMPSLRDWGSISRQRQSHLYRPPKIGLSGTCGKNQTSEVFYDNFPYFSKSKSCKCWHAPFSDTPRVIQHDPFSPGHHWSFTELNGLAPSYESTVGQHLDAAWGFNGFVSRLGDSEVSPNFSGAKWEIGDTDTTCLRSGHMSVKGAPL